MVLRMSRIPSRLATPSSATGNHLRASTSPRTSLQQPVGALLRVVELRCRWDQPDLWRVRALESKCTLTAFKPMGRRVWVREVSIRRQRQFIDAVRAAIGVNPCVQLVVHETATQRRCHNSGRYESWWPVEQLAQEHCQSESQAPLGQLAGHTHPGPATESQKEQHGGGRELSFTKQSAANCRAEEKRRRVLVERSRRA